MLSWPYHTLPVLDGPKAWRNATEFERRHWIESDCLYFVSCHNRELFLVPPDGRRRLYVAAPPSWKNYKPCRALATL